MYMYFLPIIPIWPKVINHTLTKTDMLTVIAALVTRDIVAASATFPETLGTARSIIIKYATINDDSGNTNRYPGCGRVIVSRSISCEQMLL